MNSLFRLLHRWKCKNAAQKLALDALRHLGGGEVDDRKSGDPSEFFLWHVERYLRGVSAPENEFRDYTNHVLYPVENWGGAARLARKWYWRTVESLRSRDWGEATFDAGVLVGYTSFPFSPLRTSHDERALALRPALDWCVSKLYDDLVAGRSEPQRIGLPPGDEWLESALKSGAEAARCHFETMRDRLDLAVVARRPRDLDPELSNRLGALLIRSAATSGAILQRAVAESGIDLPRYPTRMAAIFAMPSLPLFWMTRRRSHVRDRRLVRAMSAEFKASGRIETTLSESARSVGEAFEVDVLERSPATAGESPFRKVLVGDLEKKTSPVDEAPRRDNSAEPSQPLMTTSSVSSISSINPKLISRLNSSGVERVGELLAADPEDVASSLHPDATTADVAAWQDEARLRLEIGKLGPTEARLLVACGVTGSDDLAALSPVELWDLIMPVAESPDGRRLLRSESPPDLESVGRWIEAAKNVRRAA